MVRLSKKILWKTVAQMFALRIQQYDSLFLFCACMYVCIYFWGSPQVLQYISYRSHIQPLMLTSFVASINDCIYCHLKAFTSGSGENDTTQYISYRRTLCNIPISRSNPASSLIQDWEMQQQEEVWQFHNYWELSNSGVRQCRKYWELPSSGVRQYRK